MPLKKLKISQKLYLGFGTITLLMIAVLGYTYLSFQKVSYAADVNLATYKVLQESEGILASLFSIETSSRGFTITGNDKYLEAFDTGKADFQAHYNALENLISKNRKQHDRLKAFKDEYDEWLDFESSILDKKKLEIGSASSDTLSDAQSQDIQDAQNAVSLVSSGKGSNIMGKLQTMLEDINNEEKGILEVKSNNLKETEAFTFQTVLIGGAGVAALAVIISFFFSLTITRPIKILVSSTKNITRDNYQKPISLKSDRELEILIDNFNAMQLAVQTRETELKRKNEAIRLQMMEINEANRLKSQFLANMSHELRTPLNSIIGFTARVIKKCGDILPPVQLENLKIVKEEANHLLDLINDLLDYSKLEAGKMELHLETFDLANVVEEIINMARVLKEGKTLNLAHELYANEGIMMSSDRIKVKQIIINLMSNAIKYSEKGTIKLSVEKTDGIYCIKVIDEGIGIAPENLENIFDEFRQVDGSYTRKLGGTGLGLSITKKFAEMLGGRIEVTSTLGAGSCFSVYLPAAAPEAKTCPDEPEPDKAEGGSSNKTVAYLDDDTNIQRLYNQYLREQGFSTVALDSHEDVVSRIREIMPDVILLDIILPDKDGWQILAELKNNTETSGIPVIVASILSERKLAFRMKADDYLIKPISQEDLTNSILRAIAKNDEKGEKEKTYLEIGE